MMSKYKSKEANTEKQSTAATDQTNTSEPPILLGAPQFTQVASSGNDQPDRADAGKHPSPAADESKTAAPRTTPSQGTIDSRPTTPDVAFGLRLTKTQPATQVGGPMASDSLTADLSPAPDVPSAPQAASNLSTGGVASPSTPPLPEVSEAPGDDNNASSKDSTPAIRPDARPRISVPEKAMPPTLQPHSIGGRDTGSAETEQRKPELPAPKQNEAVRNEGRLQANSDTNELSASQHEIARATEPQASHAATSPSDARRAASDPEIGLTLQPQQARHISLKLTGPDSTKVDLQLTERSGKMQIAVRTPDHALAKSMQTDLSDLVGRLENRGFKAEAWIPTSGRHAEATAPPQQSSQGNSQNHQGRHSSGSGAGQQQQRHGQNDSNQRQQARWKAQLEETSLIEEMRMENI
ncbi:MAG TPA: hypothetical protein VIX89_16575 [Bryobacteraceae bacterium]